MPNRPAAVDLSVPETVSTGDAFLDRLGILELGLSWSLGCPDFQEVEWIKPNAPRGRRALVGG
ncbi:hypothetical protein [Micromonospora chokoriensis]|uniref:hypothetical protein n=1 Tax=Micromonospora chokoriensis TaxID=356851 RepID=UPI0012FB2034|nr:hypothetical protein [Micromonospora chokoriensis]